MLTINSTVKVLAQRIQYAVLACLCLLILSQPSHAVEIVSEPATLTAAQITGSVTARADVALLDRTTASIAFEASPIALSPGGSYTNNLVLTNTGQNELGNASIALTLPTGLTINIVDTPIYTAAQQADGSWLISFINNISVSQVTSIPVVFTVPSSTPLGNLNITAVLTGRGLGVTTPAAIKAISSNTTIINIQPDTPSVSLFLSNSVNKDVVIHDEFVTYTLRVSNQLITDSVNNIQITDLLPLGLRFMPGTVSLDGGAIADPAISSDGRTLVFNNLGNLAGEETLSIEYMAYISSAAPARTLVSPSSARGFLNNGTAALSNPAQATITVRKDAINTNSHLFGRVIVGQCSDAEAESLSLVNTRLQSELVDNTIVYNVNIDSAASAVEEFALHVELPASLDFNSNNILLDGVKVPDPAPGQLHKVFRLQPKGTQWQHSLQFQAVANSREHGVFNTVVYGQYRTKDAQQQSTKRMTNSYQASLEHSSFRRFSYWPRFSRLGSQLRDGDVENIDDLLDKLKGEVLNHIYIVGHADNMKISEKNKPLYESNQRLSEERAQSTAAYLKQKLDLTDDQLSVSGRGETEPVTENRTEQGRSINRRVELIVEVLNREAVNRLNIILGDEGYSSSKVHTTRSPADNTLTGVEDIRLITETGRFVDTDEYGLYHFEALKPGTHVVQIDPESIPAHLEPVQCESNTRFAGSPISRFVEIGNGLIWRANFYLQEKQFPEQTVNTSLHSKIDGKTVVYSLSASGSQGIQSPAQLVINADSALQLKPGSILLDGQPANAVSTETGIAVELGKHNQQWQHAITFTVDTHDLPAGDYTVTAQLHVNNQEHPALATQQASNTFSVTPGNLRAERYEFKTHFTAGDVDLSKVDKVTLEDIIFLFRDKTVNKIKVIGHTDASPMSAATKARFGNNYALSETRAKNIAQHIKEKLGQADIEVETSGKGASAPIASNATKEGRKANRRVELYIYTLSNMKKAQLQVTQAKSDVQTIAPNYANTQTTPETREAPQAEQSDGILSIQEGAHIAEANMAIRVQIDSRLKLVLERDGNPISHDKIGFRMKDTENNKNIMTFFGVDTGKLGQHSLTLKGVGPFGNTRFEQTVNYVRTGEVHRIEAIKHTAANAADGSTPLSAHIALYDIDGERIYANTALKILSGELKPYVADKNSLDNQINYSDESITVNRDGKLLFAPVNKAGLYTVTLGYNDAEVDLKIYATPKYREWIMVGLAEGTLGANDVSGNIQNVTASDIEDSYYDDGRLAFYAKGKILGKYLLTASFDSSKQRQEDERLQQVINPNDYYTLYGDNTEQQFDAASREKIYLRLDADRFYTMFGDMSTGMDITTLSRYNRSLTGFKAAYESERISAVAFAAETKQSFMRDEILGQGISGLYYLNGKNIVANSETIIIETRDRDHPERVLETKTLSRFSDYNIDYQDGSLYFKQAVPRNGENFNPVYIVAEYESFDKNNEDLVAGSRAALKFNDEKIEIGASIIDDGTQGAETQLQGVDLRAQLSENVELKAEYAQTESQSITTAAREGDAYLAELSHKSKKIDSRLYLQETDAQFGLGQQQQSNTGIRKLGAQTDYRFNKNIKLSAEASHQENLVSLDERDSVKSTLTYTDEGLEVDGGASITEDRDSTNNKRTAEKIHAGVSQKFFDDKLKLRARTEMQINKDNKNADSPTRHLVGADYKLFSNVDFFAEHEVANNQALKANTSRAGLRSRPWSNAVINSSVENRYSEEEERSSAVFGLTQAVPLNEKWRASFSFDQTTTLHKTTLNRVNTNAPLSSGSSFTNIPASGNLDTDFWAVSTGLAYKTTHYLFDNRLEYRNSREDDKYTVLSTWKQELNQGIGHALRLQLFHTDAHLGNEDQTSGELRYSSVYRPLDSRWIVLNRTEYKQDENTRTSSGALSKRFVENLAINYIVPHQWQAAGHFGYKHQTIQTGNNEFITDSYVIGSEMRYDINQHWDIGAQYHRLFTPQLGLAQDSYGLSVGVDVAKNLWLSVGYNAEGYYDEDFSVNGFTAQGAFIKLRFKFDQNTFNLNGSNNE